MPNLEPGYYWVKWFPHDTEWEISRLLCDYDGRSWECMGTDESCTRVGNYIDDPL
jgi:hypothetical protein